METKLTVLVDNHGTRALPGEWGLAFWVEHRGRTVLVDAGASGLFAENARRLGKDLRTVDYAVLSHAHYDHGSGIPRFFRENSTAKFHVREGVRENCYLKKYILRKYIGLPRNVLTGYADRIETVTGDHGLYEGAWLIPHKTPGLESIGRRESMYCRTDEGWQPDDFAHEQSLVLETDKGLLIINSCCHGGARNIISEVRATFPEKPIYALIGGLHLFNKSDREIRTVAREIDDSGIAMVCTGHCTKDHAYALLRDALGDRVQPLRVGLEMTF